MYLCFDVGDLLLGEHNSLEGGGKQQPRSIVHLRQMYLDVMITVLRNLIRRVKVSNQQAPQFT